MPGVVLHSLLSYKPQADKTLIEERGEFVPRNARICSAIGQEF